MSRLGDLIRTERLRSKMTPKQVARKCGVSESYLLAVEAGTKIIADDQARRILKTIGLREQTEADFSLDDIAATVDLASASPAVAKAVEHPKPQPEYELVATTKTAGKKQDDRYRQGRERDGQRLAGRADECPQACADYDGGHGAGGYRLCRFSPAKSRGRSRTRCSTSSRRTTPCAASVSTPAIWR